MKKNYLHIILQLLPFLVAAQAPIAFERYYHFLPDWGPEGYCIEQTRDGGYIVAGQEDFDLSTSYNMLAKFDSLGNPQWEHLFGATTTNNSSSVKQLPGGGYILLGHTYDQNNFITLT